MDLDVSHFFNLEQLITGGFRSISLNRYYLDFSILQNIHPPTRSILACYYGSEESLMAEWDEKERKFEIEEREKAEQKRKKIEEEKRQNEQMEKINMENPLDSLDNDTDPEVILVSPPKSPVFKVRFAFLSFLKNNATF